MGIQFEPRRGAWPSSSWHRAARSVLHVDFRAARVTRRSVEVRHASRVTSTGYSEPLMGPDSVGRYVSQTPLAFISEEGFYH